MLSSILQFQIYRTSSNRVPQRLETHRSFNASSITLIQVLVTAIVVATVNPVIVIAPTQPEKKHWTMMVRVYKGFSFTS